MRDAVTWSNALWLNLLSDNFLWDNLLWGNFPLDNILWYDLLYTFAEISVKQPSI